MKQANHGGIKGESVEELESADTEVNATPSRQRRRLRPAADTEEGQEVDSENQTTQADDGADLMQQQDVTVGFCCLVSDFLFST